MKNVYVNLGWVDIFVVYLSPPPSMECLSVCSKILFCLFGMYQNFLHTNFAHFLRLLVTVSVAFAVSSNSFKCLCVVLVSGHCWSHRMSWEIFPTLEFLEGFLDRIGSIFFWSGCGIHLWSHQGLELALWEGFSYIVNFLYSCRACLGYLFSSCVSFGILCLSDYLRKYKDWWVGSLVGGVHQQKNKSASSFVNFSMNVYRMARLLKSIVLLVV